MSVDRSQRWRFAGESGPRAKPVIAPTRTPTRHAIYRMARTILRLEEFERTILARREPHPLCGLCATLSVGTIHGGLSVNTVPDECVVEVDRRILPGERSDEAYREVIEFLGSGGDRVEGIEHEAPFLDGKSLTDDVNRDLAGRLSEAVDTVSEGCRQIGVLLRYRRVDHRGCRGADRRLRAGIDSTGADTADEWLSVSQLELASEALYQFVARGL